LFLPCLYDKLASFWKSIQFLYIILCQALILIFFTSSNIVPFKTCRLVKECRLLYFQICFFYILNNIGNNLVYEKTLRYLVSDLVPVCFKIMLWSLLAGWMLIYTADNITVKNMARSHRFCSLTWLYTVDIDKSTLLRHCCEHLNKKFTYS
jgi:hypothetical protein